MKYDGLVAEWDPFDHKVQLHFVFAEMERRTGGPLSRDTGRDRWLLEQWPFSLSLYAEPRLGWWW